MTASHKVYNREYARRKRNGLPCEREQLSLQRDSAMYVHRDPFGGDRWEAKHANRADIVGYGQTRVEAIIACEESLNQKYDEMYGAAVKEEPDPLEPTECVGTVHVT